MRPNVARRPAIFHRLVEPDPEETAGDVVRVHCVVARDERHPQQFLGFLTIGNEVEDSRRLVHFGSILTRERIRKVIWAWAKVVSWRLSRAAAICTRETAVPGGGSSIR